MVLVAALLLPGLVPTPLPAAAASSFASAVVGNPADVSPRPLGGVALMGGGPDVDAAFRWLGEQAAGGDVVVLRASGGNGYNRYIRRVARVDSVQTIVVRDRAAARHPAVLRAVERAEALFIAGGDQSVYLDLWDGTPLARAVDRRLREGMAIGGSSAGLAILGRHVYSARNGTVTSRGALANPFNRRMTLARSPFAVPGLGAILTDSHFAERNREGRLVALLARLNRAGADVRGIGVDEGTAALVTTDGTTAVVGDGRVLFVDGRGRPQRCEPGRALTYRRLSGVWVSPSGSFDLASWQGGGRAVRIDVVRGRYRERPLAGEGR